MTELIPVADLPAAIRRTPERIQRWIDWRILTVIHRDGTACVDRAEVEPLRHPVTAVKAELAAAERDGRPILSPEALALVVRALSPAVDELRAERRRAS